MLERVLYPLLIATEFPQLYGKTRFQKLTFLIQKAAERQKIEGPKFKFTIYLHGPFSFELNNTIGDLVQDGFLHEGLRSTRDGNRVYFYRLTTKGKSTVRKALQKNLLSKIELRLISQVVDQYRHLPLDQLVEEAYRQYGVQRPH